MSKSRRERARRRSTRNRFFTMPDGSEHCDVELCVSDLLRDEVLFCNHRLYDPDTWCKPSGKTEGPTLILFVALQDVFYWATSDAEDLTTRDVGPLWKAHEADKRYGAIKWACLKRNLRPQIPLMKAMQKAGAWCAELEALPAPEPS